MSLDFRPDGRAASRASQVWAHGITEARLVARNGEQLLLALVIPIGILVAARWFGDTVGLSFDAMVASVFGLAMWSTCFTALAVSTGFERRYNVLERLSATPLGTTGILLGKSLAFTLITAGQIVILAVVALLLGWLPTFEPLHLLVALVASVLAMAVFALFGLALSGSQRPEVTLGLANLIYLVGMPLGILVPLATFPGWAQPLVGLLPTSALGEALRAGTLLSIPVLLAWCLAGLLLARKVFKWTS